MRNARLIARLDIKGPNLIKGIHLEGLRVIRQPNEYATARYLLGYTIVVWRKRRVWSHCWTGVNSGPCCKYPLDNNQGRITKDTAHRLGRARVPGPDQNRSWQADLLTDITLGEAIYFAHSFMAVPASHLHRLADCTYGGISISAAVQRDNVFGCQFHPKKSGEVGLKLLCEFIRQ